MNTFAWGFDNKCHFKILETLNKSTIDVKVWVKQIEKKKPKLCKNIYFYNDLFLKNKFHIHSQAPSSIIKQMEPERLEFLLMQARHQVNYCSTEKTISKTPDEDLNSFYKFIHFFYHLLKTEKIKLVLFANIFHEGADFILYKLAKIMKIRTILCYQSIFPNKFIIIESIEEFGNLKLRPSLFDKAQFKYIEPNTKAVPFYMKKIEDAEFHLKEINLVTLESNIKAYFFNWFIACLTNNVSFILNQINNIGNRYRKKPLEKYIKNITKHTYKPSINFNEKFVYLPLHLQPELTTAALGKKYVDQLRIIEDLRAYIPKSVSIFIKENPKQWEAMRPTSFFKRLAEMENVKLLNITEPSIKLIRKSLCVAVVSGTAGWEAIQLGKPVLLFGYAWYQNLSGVYDFKTAPSFEKIIQEPIDTNTIESQLNDLTTRFGDGLLDRDYKQIYPEFNNKTNISNVANSINKIINYQN